MDTKTHRVVDYGPGPFPLRSATPGYPFEGSEKECSRWVGARRSQYPMERLDRYEVQELADRDAGVERILGSFGLSVPSVPTVVMRNRILCTRPCNVSREFFVIPGHGHLREGRPYLMVVQRERGRSLSYTDAELTCADVVVDEDIPHVGRLVYWGNHHLAELRARVLFRGEFYTYLLQDNLGWPWVEVPELNFVPEHPSEAP